MGAHVDTDELATRVLEHLRENAGELQLDADGLQVRYVLNWGGFTSASYTVSDGLRALHLKLVPDERHQRRLRRWQSVHELLTERYRAPRMEGWLDVHGWAGPLFERIDGGPPKTWPDAALTDEVARLVEALHRDEDLAARIAEPGRALRSSFTEYFVECMRVDLLEMTRDDGLPPFIDAATLSWMQEEVEALHQLCADSAAFDGPALLPAHGDLWEGNILVRPDGSWHVVDWDDLALGDPALDMALLLWSAVDAGVSPARWLGTRDPAFSARFDLSRRGALLLGVVDSLADWTEAAKAPTHAARARDAKAAHHRWALGRYRELYG